MTSSPLEFREPWHLRGRERLVLAVLVGGSIVADVVRGTVITLVLFPVIAAYIADQVRARVVVTDVDVVIVRALWKRRIARSRVRAIRSSPQWLARLLVDESNFGVQLPFDDPELVRELARELGVPIEAVE